MKHVEGLLEERMKVPVSAKRLLALTSLLVFSPTLRISLGVSVSSIDAALSYFYYVYALFGMV